MPAGRPREELNYECSRCHAPGLTADDFYFYFANGRHKPRHMCKTCFLDIQKAKTGINIFRRKQIGELIMNAHDMVDIKDRVEDLLEELIADAVACGALRVTPCTICGSIRHLRPKFVSYRQPFNVEWRCVAHRQADFVGKPAPFQQYLLDPNYMSHVFKEKEESVDA